jgi:hypothetical protein
VNASTEKTTRDKTLDYEKIIQGLKAERDQVVRVIAELEKIERAAQAKSPETRKGRGRKVMGAPERREVSERMKRYWASRRSEKTAADPQD